MASRKFIPYSQPKNIPDSIITSYAQSKSISSSSSHLICPAEKYTQFKFSPYMASQRPYLIFTSYGQPKTIPYFIPYVQPKSTIVCSRCHAHNIMVHLHSDVDIHPHHLHVHVHSTRPFVSTECSPCLPPRQLLRVTQLLLPAFRRFARTRDERAKPGPVYPSRTVNIASLNKLVYLTFDTKFQT